MELRLRQIISGGQTGVDRAALDVALFLGIDHAGWCPRGRLAEDGPLPEKYRLRETDASEYWVRTERNVQDADATLIVHRGPLSGGTDLTRKFCLKHGRPHWVADLGEASTAAAILAWLVETDPAVLNIAGPRESSCPGIEEQTRELLLKVLDGDLAAGNLAAGGSEIGHADAKRKRRALK